MRIPRKPWPTPKRPAGQTPSRPAARSLGERVIYTRQILTGERWELERRDDIQLAGVEPCLPVVGLGRASSA